MNDGSRQRLVSASGFTLIELLIAISILGLLLTAAFGSLTLGSRSWERSIRKADANQDLRLSVDFVRRQFAHLTPISFEVDGEQHLAFTGEPGVARFVAPAPDSMGGGLTIVTLAVERHADDANVWFSVAPFDPGATTGFEIVEAWQRPLFTELEDASISYYGAPTDEDERAWRSYWRSDAAEFPRAVRLTSLTGDAEQPLELLFRIRARELL